MIDDKIFLHETDSEEFFDFQAYVPSPEFSWCIFAGEGYYLQLFKAILEALTPKVEG